MLAVETRASAAVGLAISVTTVPASAYLGVAAVIGGGTISSCTACNKTCDFFELRRMTLLTRRRLVPSRHRAGQR
jgi:hypothetical protein